MPVYPPVSNIEAVVKEVYPFRPAVTFVPIVIQRYSVLFLLEIRYCCFSTLLPSERFAPVSFQAPHVSSTSTTLSVKGDVGVLLGSLGPLWSLFPLPEGLLLEPPPPPDLALDSASSNLL